MGPNLVTHKSTAFGSRKVGFTTEGGRVYDNTFGGARMRFDPARHLHEGQEAVGLKLEILLVPSSQL